MIERMSITKQIDKAQALEFFQKTCTDELRFCPKEISIFRVET